MKSKTICRNCAHMKRAQVLGDNVGICSMLNVVQNMDIPIKCSKWIREPTKDELDMHDISTVPNRNLIDY